MRFAKVDTGIYKGSSPKNDADFRYLKSLHIKYILNLRFLPILSYREKKKAEKYGFTFISVRMNASPIPPSEKHMKRILTILKDPCYHPIYFHCQIGRDRSSLVAVLYKMYFQHVSPEEGKRQLAEYGFKNSWTLHGLSGYLRKHPRLVPPITIPEHECEGAQ